MDLHLQDKTALVTGGSRGLGRAICLALAAEGARVAVNYRSRVDDAEETVRQIALNHGTSAMAVGADVTDEADVLTMFDQVESVLGPIDILINNAGTWPHGMVRDLPKSEWDAAIDVNLTGPFLTCREAVRRFTAEDRAPDRSPGRIVNVTSQAAHHGATSGHAHYAAAKAGLTNFTHSLAREVASDGICVNAVAPGVMPTEMIREALDRDGERYLARIPLKRWARLEEVAAAVLFLASDQASYITGTTLDVNGGMVMR